MEQFDCVAKIVAGAVKDGLENMDALERLNPQLFLQYKEIEEHVGNKAKTS